MSAIKKLVFTLFVISGFIIFSNQLKAQVPDEIIQSLKSGDSKKFSAYFNQNIELVVLENDNVYSKAQAEQIISKFFSKNTPESFDIIHESSAEGANLVIGNLVTNNGDFRVYIFLRKNAGKDYIFQLRIGVSEEQ
jgi:hypothetical protein